MSKRKNVKLHAYEIAEEQSAVRVKSTVEIMCDTLLREYRGKMPLSQNEREPTSAVKERVSKSL